MSGGWWNLAGVLGLMVFDLWMFSAIGIFFFRIGWPSADLSLVRAVRAELRPFALPGLLLSYAMSALGDHGLSMWGYIGLGLNLFNWWYWRRDNDDDRWKRRRKKLADKVFEVSGRLQVVPAGAS